MSRTVRKIGLFVFLLAWVAVAIYGYHEIHGSSSGLTTITIGYQTADPVDIARQRGDFAKKMKQKGYHVVFKKFQDGASEMQALKSGSIDYARIGDTPPVTALSSGTDLVYVASGSSKAKGSGILVKKGSGITSIKDLKGKRVAYTKSTSSHFLLLNALKKAGMSSSDIKWVNLDQSAASVAFNKGKVDAWVTWDPMTATAELDQNATLLETGENGVSSNRDYILATKSYAADHTDTSKLIINYLEDDMKWANNHHTKLITMLSKSLGLSKKVVKKMVERRTYAMGKMSTTAIKEEQEIADTFYAEGLIKKKVTIKNHVAD
ncbi:ABC-type nitrate sulfonate bicarbonate transporter [Lactobacillus selangorensis]|uniref:Putative aliphatic sulfonates-binding protein n=1 Tax=Lactobacillus selangorensis TaxID=81857 RepID=A0A0R2FJ67_9LACO|nr:aliphatic sulfonate ABC transporter substrate-binding protein [Lactobacillus selangorensis]KRN28648.1 ABC-type nitrate sulfonate bicarbonate transporter [Lactobacillus selangorensis]KRN32942.1 ABC-type nitrate sulfonate bicarbonate transporter [Lactobacillus selangorensis]